MDLHLTKPIQKEKVVEAVHQVLKEDNWWMMVFVSLVASRRVWFSSN
jgi:hypothetical protein